MFKRLVPLSLADRGIRLPQYGRCLPGKNPIVVPIAPIEASRLADRFPIAWRRWDERWEPVCLTGFVESDPQWPTNFYADEGTSTALPLVLGAYPFTIVDDGVGAALTVFREMDVDDPAGIPIFTADGEMNAHATQRCQALWTFVGDRRATFSLHEDLHHEDVFLPWDLKFKQVVIEGLCHVDNRFFGTKAHRRVVDRHGWRAANLLTMHRISLFRTDSLFRLSRRD